MWTLPTSFLWEIPIRNIIPTDYDYTVPGETCLTGCGAYFLELKFWCCVKCPYLVVRKTLKHVGKRSPSLITMNSVECATIKFSCNSILEAISEPHTQHPPQPKSIIRIENTTADSLTRNIATSSLTGKNLKILFWRLLTNQLLGLDSAHLPGRDKQVAGKISYLSKDNLTSTNSLL